MTDGIYKGFIGDWMLDVDTCDFEQGDPPQSATNSITLEGDEIVIGMDWTDAEGESHHMSFRAVPDGRKIPFNGGPLADQMSVTATSESELVVSAFRNSIELMTATRELSHDVSRMDLVQTVHLPDGTSPVNHSTYHRRQ